MIKIADKASFIKWFLKKHNHNIGNRESVWLLNYILNHHDVLLNTHFVETIHLCPRGIIISTNETKETPFEFRKRNLIHNDPQNAFYDVRINRDESLFIQLNFKDPYMSLEYLNVIEENPFLPEVYYIEKRESELAERFLDYCIYNKQKNDIKKQIDNALDNHNKDKFLKWSNLLLELEKTNKQRQKRSFKI